MGEHAAPALVGLFVVWSSPGGASVQFMQMRNQGKSFRAGGTWLSSSGLFLE